MYSGMASFSGGLKLVPAQHCEARLELPVPTWPWQSPCVISRDQTQLWAMSCTWLLQPALLGQANLAPSLRTRELLCQVTVSDANISSEGSGNSRVAWVSQPAPRPASSLGERSPGAQWGLSPGPCSTLNSWEGAQWCKGSLGHAPPGACSAELAALAGLNATGA